MEKEKQTANNVANKVTTTDELTDNVQKITNNVEVLSEEVDKTTAKTEKEIHKEKFKLLKVSIWQIFAYFIIYSIIGFILETLFGLATKGVIESRKSFLYGPFCAIYGLGASVMIIFLKHFEKNNTSLFVGGMIIGTITEYLVSLFGEIMLHVKWWDYSNLPLNVNGRVCLLFSVVWGFLGIFLMTIANPIIDKFINFLKKKLTAKIGKIILTVSVILLAIDWVVSTVIVGLFLIRVTHDYDLNVENKAIVNKMYAIIYSNKDVKEFIEEHFGNERLIRNFPDLKTTDVDGNIIFYRKLMPEIQPYYFKIFNKKLDEKWEFENQN